MPVAEQGYPTPTELGSLLQLAIAANDATALLLIDLAFASVQNEARQRVRPVDGDVVTLEAAPSRVLWLPERPVRAVTNVAVEDVAIPATDYRWNARGRLERKSGLWIDTAGTAVTVTYDHGFATIPNDIRMAALQAAARTYVNPDGAVQEALGSHSLSYGADTGLPLTPEERRIARRYRWGIPA